MKKRKISELPDVIKLTKIKLEKDEEKKVEIAKRINSDSIKLEAIELIDDRNKRTQVALTIKDDKYKIMVIDKIDEMFETTNVTILVQTLKTDKAKLRALERISDKKLIFDIIKSLSEKQNKLEAIKFISDVIDKRKIYETMDLSEEEKLNIIKNADPKERLTLSTLLDNDESLLKLFELYENEEEKIGFVISIKDDNIKLGIIDKFITFEEKYEIISSMNSDESKKIAILRLEDDNDKIKALKSIDSDEIKIEIIKQMDINYRNYAIQEYISDEEILLKEIENIEGIDIFSIAINLKSEENRIKTLKLFNNLNNAKIKIIQTIEDNERKLKLIEEYISQDGKSEAYKIIIGSIKDQEFVKEHIRLLAQIEYAPDDKKVDEIAKKLERLYEKNEDIILKINYKMLEDKYYEYLGEDLINFIGLFPQIQRDILNLDPKKQDVFFKCFNRYRENTKNDDLTLIINSLLENINGYDLLIDNIEDIEKVDIDRLLRIMQNQNDLNIKRVEEIEEFDDIKVKRTNELIKEDSIEEKQKAIFLKIFGHDKKFAEKINIIYGDDINNIEDEDLKAYVKAIRLILECDSSEVLEQIYYCEKFVTLIDKCQIEQEIRKEYAKTYEHKPTKIEDLEQIGENIYSAGTEFNFILTSVGAYHKIKDKEMDFKKNWNRNSIMAQHICTSYIRNDMIGTAPIEHFCYGFDSMNEDSLLLAGPHDIASSNSDFVSSTKLGRVAKFYSANEMINHTEIYNELDFKRIQQGVKKQPSYIIVFKKDGKISNMDEALKAQKDWNNLPIIVVDIDLCLESEKNKLFKIIDEYNRTKNPYLKREIYYKLRNNRQTSNEFCKDIDIEEYKDFEQEIEDYEKDKSEQRVSLIEIKGNFNQISPSEREEGINSIRILYAKIEKEVSKSNKEER